MLSRGAADYLLFPCEPAEIQHKISRIMAHQQLNLRFTSIRLDSPDDPVFILDDTLREIMQTLELDPAIALICRKAQQLSGAGHG
jgi:hypothetical protein